MKKLLCAAALLLSLGAFANKNVDEDLQKRFSEAFPEATTVKWFDNPETYDVYFVHNKVQCRIVYTKDGEMIRMRRDYTREALPFFISGAVQKKYPGKQIHGVTEITTPAGIEYHLVLEDDKHWTFVESTSGGDLFTTRKLRKA